MARIIITETDEYGDTTTLGWFDPARCESFEEGTRWDGNNNVGLASGSQWVDETLYRTKAGRWVLNRNATRYHNGPDSYRFLDDGQAQDWLRRAGNDEGLTKYFGPDEEERGPGRPAIGAQIKIAMDPDTVARVDAAATTEGISRAEWIRRAVMVALG